PAAEFQHAIHLWRAYFSRAVSVGKSFARRSGPIPDPMGQVRHWPAHWYRLEHSREDRHTCCVRYLLRRGGAAGWSPEPRRVGAIQQVSSTEPAIGCQWLRSESVLCKRKLDWRYLHGLSARSFYDAASFVATVPLGCTGFSQSHGAKVELHRAAAIALA